MIIAGIFGSFQDAITAPDSVLLKNSLALGHEIFVTIFMAMVVVGLCKCAISQDFNMFWWNMGSLLFKMLPPVVALNFASIILPQMKAITTFFIGRISGNTTFGDADALIDLGTQTGNMIIHAASEPVTSVPGVIKTIADPGMIPVILTNEIFAFITTAFVLIAFYWVAMELIVAWYQVLLASSVGAASVGFFGSEATSDMAFRYTSGVVAGVWKVIFLTIWPATVMAVFQNAIHTTNLNNPYWFLSTAIELFAFSVVVFGATFRIVQMADKMFSGQAAFTLREIGEAVSKSIPLANKMRKK